MTRKTIQLGIFLLGTFFLLSACNDVNKKEDKTKSVTRISYAKGFDMQSTRMDSPVIYDAQGRITQIDFVTKIIYEENKVTAIYKPENAQYLLRNELTLKDGKPVSIYAEFRDPANPTSLEVSLISKGTFQQNGDTLFVEESFYKRSSDEVFQKVTSQWITDDTGHLKQRDIKITKDGNEQNFLSTCFYDKTHACPDIVTAYFTFLMGSADFLLLISGNQPGAVKSMLSHIEMEGAPFPTISFANEYDDAGFCVRVQYRADSKILSDIKFDYETVTIE